MTSAMEKGKEPTVEKSVEPEQPSEPSELPPPYVDPIPIPRRRPPSPTQRNEFSGHPGPRGEPAEYARREAVVDTEEEPVSENGANKKNETKGDARNGHYEGAEYVGVFRME